MDKVSYMGYTLIPYGNIIGKDEQTRFQRLSWRTDTLTPLLNKADGYDYNEFNKAAGAAADIYYYPQTKHYYVPTGGGLFGIDVTEMRKYVKLLKQDGNRLNPSEDHLYSLGVMKKVLGDDYGFHLLLPADELKKAIETNTVADSVYQIGVVAVLEAGNLDIEMNILSLSDKDGEAPFLEYFCCVRTNGEWESYEEIPVTVNLDVPDLEAEMFRVLDKFAEERALSFFAQNDHITQNGQSLDTEEETNVSLSRMTQKRAILM